MRLTRLFLPTVRENPADAEVTSHRLMVRAGMVRRVAAGIYNLLPLGVRVTQKVETVVREEMNRAGAQEVAMPLVTPSELWTESGRWDEYGSELLRLQDRHGRDFCLGPTHEEVVTDMVRREIRSYKQLPLNLYQIQTKFRDEIRPRFGLMRGREFVMKDAYSFHADMDSAKREYQNMFDTYSRIFERCGLRFRAVEADSGNIGGSFSHEFMVLADTGEDAVVSCTSCDYGANVERAEIGSSGNESSGGEPSGELTEVSTPNKKTVEEVSEFLKISPADLIKTLIYTTDKGTVAALVRGDREVNELKVKRAFGAAQIELADDEIVKEATGAPTGFAGPVGLTIPIYADFEVAAMTAGVTGANKNDTHLTNVNPERDFKAEYTDIRTADKGDPCPRCGKALEINRGIEVGHIFMLGTKYSESMNCVFLDENGKEQPMIMGCYGIGIGRTAAAAIEQNHDEGGIIWPKPIAPFSVEIIPVNMKDEATVRCAEELYDKLIVEGIETLIDDRKERAGVKFNDADLIGIPVRITVGPRGVKEGEVEIKERSAEEAEPVKISDAVEFTASLLAK